jgi:hypothetical protein
MFGKESPFQTFQSFVGRDLPFNESVHLPLEISHERVAPSDYIHM